MKKHEIEKWLLEHGVRDYTIRDNLIVDVRESVRLSNLGLTRIPIAFGHVEGGFDCSYNRLESLEGCPQVILRGFKCNDNLLKSLEYGPQLVKLEYDCSNNLLENLVGSPLRMEGSFYCLNNKIIDLIGSSEVILGRFDCSRNFLISLKNAPLEILREIICNDNPLETLDLFNIKLHSIILHTDDNNYMIPGFEDLYDINEKQKKFLGVSPEDIQQVIFKQHLNNSLNLKKSGKKPKI